MKLTAEQAKKMMSENDGNIDLRNTQITELPDNLTVGLKLIGKNIKKRDIRI